MSAVPLTRQQVERAGDLDFARPPRTAAQPERQVKPEILIAVKAQLDGFPIELSFSGSVEQLSAIVKRLREMGAEPLTNLSNSTIVEKPRKPAAKRVEPVYNDAGEACCPKHNKVLKDGKWGLYCPAKDDTTERGYCALKFAE